MRESKGGKPARRNASELGDAESTDDAATRTDLDPRVIGSSGSPGSHMLMSRIKPCKSKYK